MCNGDSFMRFTGIFRDRIYNYNFNIISFVQTEYHRESIYLNRLSINTLRINKNFSLKNSKVKHNLKGSKTIISGETDFLESKRIKNI